MLLADDREITSLCVSWVKDIKKAFSRRASLQRVSIIFIFIPASLGLIISYLKRRL